MPTFSNNTLFKKHKNEIPLSTFDESNENKRHSIVVFPDKYRNIQHALNVSPKYKFFLIKS